MGLKNVIRSFFGALLQGPAAIGFLGQTSDPTVDDGTIWYRSDTDVLKLKSNGSVKTLLATADVDYGEAGDLATVGTAAASAGTSDEFARADHKHAIDTATVATVATTQTITGAKKFTTLLLQVLNGAGTFVSKFATNATADRTVTFPDADFTVPQDSLVAHLAGAETFSGAKDFAANTLKVDNNSTTNAHTLASAATAARTATLPDASGTLVMQDGAQANGATVANVATGNVIGGIPVEHMFTIGDAAGNTDITLTHKTQITDVTVVKRAGAGGAGDTVQVLNGASAISNAMSLNVSDKAVVRAGEIDDAANTVNAAGTLRVTIVDGNAGGTDLSCFVFVKGFRSA